MCELRRKRVQLCTSENSFMDLKQTFEVKDGKEWLVAIFPALEESAFFPYASKS